MNQLLKNLSLHPLPYDSRDFSHENKFGSLSVPKIPTSDFSIYDTEKYTIKWGDTLSSISSKYKIPVVSILKENQTITNPNKIRSGTVLNIPFLKYKITDQQDLDFCAGFSSLGANMALWNTEFDPYYQFAKIKQVRGEYKAPGANLRDAAKALVRYGSLPQSSAPYSHNIPPKHPEDKDRDFLANWKNYPIGLDSLASKYRDGSYYIVDGPYDAFDNIRTALYQHLDEKRAVLFGLNWRPEWTGAPGGIIEDNYVNSQGAGHAVILIGQKKINGQFYLILQNSWGTNFGDNGFFYLPRGVVNKEFLAGYGQMMFSRSKGGLTSSNWVIDLFRNLMKPFK